MIYLDHNASTPVRPQVIEALIGEISDNYANPANESHSAGRLAASRYQQAVNRVSEVLGCDRREVFLTSGATESLTLAAMGFGLSDPQRPDFALSTIEHAAVLSAAERVTALTKGQLVQIPTSESGLIETERAAVRLSERTGVCFAMAVNNETGVVQELSGVVEAAKRSSVPLVVDMTQAVGKLDLSQAWLSADALVFSGHKFGAPKGTGALVIKRESHRRFLKMMPGGGQQRGFRGGTENAPMAVALSVALELAVSERQAWSGKVGAVVAGFLAELELREVNFKILGSEHERVDNTAMIRIPGVDAELLLSRVPQVALSLGSACHFGDDRPSHVLTAMGLTRAESAECFRLSAGWSNEPGDGQAAGALVAEAAVEILKRSGI